MNQQDAPFLLTHFNNNPLHVSSRLAAYLQDQLYMRYVDWLLAGLGADPASGLST
jgi:hypothetical protein